MPLAIGWQRVEGALVFGAALAVLAGDTLPFGWVAALLVFFSPDLAFAGYLAGPRWGARAYNALHLYGFGAAVAAFGAVWDHQLTLACGLLWIAHAGFDRMQGYGLKSPEGFGFTHLGRIGRS